MNYFITQTHQPDLSFIKSVMKAPVLSKELEYHLTLLWHETKDEKALHQLICSYTRLVVSVALRYRRYGIPLIDLIQEGSVGLLEAAERFQPNRNVRFSAYAKWWVRAHIQSFVLRNWSIVRTGTTGAQKNLFFSLNRIKKALERASTDMLPGEIQEKAAHILKVSIRDVNYMEERLSKSDFSLSSHIHEDGHVEWQELLRDTGPTPEEKSMIRQQEDNQKNWISEALQCLTPREYRIISKRRLTESPQTLESIGRDLKITKERVRQLEVRALRKMRYHFLKTNIHQMLESL